MSPSEQIDECMLCWEEARAVGTTPSPEALCADCPELLTEVRQRIRAIVEMERLLGVGPRNPLSTVRDGRLAIAPEPLPSLPGYQILRELGHGGMGVVYEAVQLDLARRVAIKTISGPHLSPKALARFRTEAEAAARLQHPNVVQIFEVGQFHDRPFFSMEFAEGGNLAQYLAHTELTSRQAAELVETLARAVHEAHKCGIVHRDLKPTNVLLTATGIPKIADFGLAKRIDEGLGHTQTGEILGTPAYMAPEQAEGKKAIGPATDVYALGAILYETLTRRPPFQGDSALNVLRAVTTQDPDPPSWHLPGLPRDLEAICLKCLEKSPARRYASAQELADDLRRFLEGRPVLARQIGMLRWIGKWLRRHPREAALVGVLLLLVSIPLVFLLAQIQAERAIRQRAERQAPLAQQILRRNCAECHDQDSEMGRKNFDVLNHIQLLANERRIVVPGAPDNSRLIQRIADGSMPPEEDEIRLPRLTESELTVLREWIQGGAPAFPSSTEGQADLPDVPADPLAAEVGAIFQRRCYECHRHDVARGGIKILHHRLLVNVRQVVIPGRPDESELFHLVTGADGHRMPPAPKARLTGEEVEMIREWIAAGAAPFPKGE